MLFWLARYLEHHLSALHVFNYLTIRAILAAITSLLLALIIAPKMIQRFKQYRVGQVVRDDGPQSHLDKTGTPTMGGSLILISLAVSTLLWADLGNRYIWVTLLTTLGFGVIGFVDDFKKLVLNHPKGLASRWKYFWQSAIALIVAVYLYATAQLPIETTLTIPFFKNLFIPLGGFYVLLTYFVLVGSSNAVNLTDGLDGLAILPCVLVCGALGIFAYLTGHVAFSKYLVISYIPGVGELAIFCAALVGAGLGFLWYNTYPAQLFMGDVGSLALGAALGVIAVLVRQELVLFLMGGIFVVETLSVMIQVGSFKLRGKRVFRMAPIHHHFELQGWPEPRIIVRFWIITVVLVLMGLATLKLR